MSLFNGNGMKATGRSSSQRSIHDYPEHLNPFYEDENHKRLRFWKLGMDEKKPSRSNSTFSINGLKGLWSFKSFKMKKKSSTLGINKTSESPTFARRDDDCYGSQSNVGRTVNIGLASNFQRGAGYRCSLQDLNSVSRPSENVFFVRNHRYRSTAQPSSSSGSQYQKDAHTVSPTSRSRFNQSNLLRGSSQISVNSGNPFEDEYSDTMSQIGSPDRDSIRRSGRKKRRAPQPPVSPAQMSNKSIATVEETSAEVDEIANISCLTAEIESFVQAADTDKENIDSTNALHSELRINECETKANEINRENVRDSSRQSPESNEYYPQDEQNDVITLEKIQNLGSMDVDVSNNSERCKKSPVKIIIRAPTDEEPTTEESIEIIQREGCSGKETPNIQGKESIETIKTHEEEAGNQLIVQTRSASEAAVNAAVSNDEQSNAERAQHIHVETIKEIITETDDNNNNNNCFNAKEPVGSQDDDCFNKTTTSACVEYISENNSQNETITNLRIIESIDDLPSATDPKLTKEYTTKEDEEEEIVQIRPKPPIEKMIEKTKEFERGSSEKTETEFKLQRLQNYDIRRVPLKLDSLESTKKNNFDGDENETQQPIPPQRRRSVKEIIDSINKCQSLLKMNQKENGIAKDKISPTQTSVSSSLSPVKASSSKLMNSKNTFADRNLNDSNEKQYQDKKMFNDVAEINNNGKRFAGDLIPTVVEEHDEINNNEIHNENGIIFEKCVVRGDRNLNETKKSNVEWNPVPKPRRHRQSQ